MISAEARSTSWLRQPSTRLRRSTRGNPCDSRVTRRVIVDRRSPGVIVDRRSPGGDGGAAGSLRAAPSPALPGSFGSPEPGIGGVVMMTGASRAKEVPQEYQARRSGVARQDRIGATDRHCRALLSLLHWCDLYRVTATFTRKPSAR